MNTSIAAFFRRKGAIELMCIADKRQDYGRFTDLDDDINVSHSTLSKRLDEAQEIGLITPGFNPKASSTETVYNTTQMGRQIQREMKELGLPRMYEKLRTIEGLFIEESEEFVEWAEKLDAALAVKAEEYSKQVEDPDVNMNPDVEFSPLDRQVQNAVFNDLENIEAIIESDETR